MGYHTRSTTEMTGIVALVGIDLGLILIVKTSTNKSLYGDPRRGLKAHNLSGIARFKSASPNQFLQLRESWNPGFESGCGSLPMSPGELQNNFGSVA